MRSIFRFYGGCLLAMFSTASCAEVLGIETWEDPPASSVGGGGGQGNDVHAGGGGAGLGPAKETCDDGNKNGGETDIDCGGPDCPACIAGETCDMHTDCESQVCYPNATCSSAGCLSGGDSCRNCVKDEGETDIGCGGDTMCPRCRADESCLAGTDCLSGVCTAAGQCAKGDATAPCYTATDCMSGECKSDESCKTGGCCT